jgi:hypothetical protein
MTTPTATGQAKKTINLVRIIFQIKILLRSTSLAAKI